jgi:hypothetical protein
MDKHIDRTSRSRLAAPLLALAAAALLLTLSGVAAGSTSRATVKTHAGHPLYRFLEDKKPGETTGEGSKLFGGGWYVVTPTGKKIDRD